MLQPIEATDQGTEVNDTAPPRIVPPRKKATTTPRTPKATAATRVRPPARPEPQPQPLALQATSHGRELIWERDPVLDTYLDHSTKPHHPAHVVAAAWDQEQEELAGWFTEHAEDLPDVLTLWPHVRVHKRPFVHSVRERLHDARHQNMDSAADLWRLLRRVQVVLTAENCVKGVDG